MFWVEDTREAQESGREEVWLPRGRCPDGGQGGRKKQPENSRFGRGFWAFLGVRSVGLRELRTFTVILSCSFELVSINHLANDRDSNLVTLCQGLAHFE